MDEKELGLKATEEDEEISDCGDSNGSSSNHYSYNDDEESSSDESSSYSYSSEDEYDEGFLAPFRTSFLRRRAKSKDSQRQSERYGNNNDNSIGYNNNNDNDNNLSLGSDGDDSKRQRPNAAVGISTAMVVLLWRKFLIRSSQKMSITTALLILSFVFWLYIQLMYYDYDHDANDVIRDKNADALQDRLFLKRSRTQMTPGQIAQLRQQRRTEAKKALGSAAADTENSILQSAKNGLYGVFGRNRKKKKKENVEDLPKGCIAENWHKKSLPNCNSLHEIPLRDAFFAGRRHLKHDDDENTHGEVGYVADGLWRHVWSINPQSEPHNKYILKMMKPEHEVNTRNIDRHRRDALVMEILTSSPHVVSIYGYCGNTVLTEYVGRDLDEIIYDGGDEIYGRTRRTPEGRLRLALDVAKGIQSLHEIKGGPIIHADITAKQYLVDSNGAVKLNDFNRCRFTPHKINSDERCEIKIPSAPGTYRSPEEYAYSGLTAKIDVYSVAHLLYGILTGNRAWEHSKLSQIKKMISDGRKPPIPPEFLKSNTSDADLAVLVDLAYEIDPENRISASELVDEIERLFQKFAVL